MEELILVDEQDNEIGTAEKILAHEKGLLHRAFSIFIFNDNCELMLQKRAISKYHSGGLWTNTCCSHPRPRESLVDATSRRLMEEMGIKCMLSRRFSFIYKAKLDKGLTEYELDHVFFGIFNSEPKLNPKEAENWKFISLSNLLLDVENNPNKYTYWLCDVLPKISEEAKKFFNNKRIK
jgi:isopentenyl-diphosphate Delta-isomerase